MNRKIVESASSGPPPWLNPSNWVKKPVPGPAKDVALDLNRINDLWKKAGFTNKDILPAGITALLAFGPSVLPDTVADFNSIKQFAIWIAVSGGAGVIARSIWIKNVPPNERVNIIRFVMEEFKIPVIKTTRTTNPMTGNLNRATSSNIKIPALDLIKILEDTDYTSYMKNSDLIIENSAGSTKWTVKNAELVTIKEYAKKANALRNKFYIPSILGLYAGAQTAKERVDTSAGATKGRQSVPTVEEINKRLKQNPTPR